jgi:7,8-dihydropterin-6-yl-methyl-4-(beta-D-ribofuranosyl)aminobenzene 5'-phosphate synthase
MAILTNPDALTSMGPSPDGSSVGEARIRLTVLYDNRMFQDRTQKDWGFSCLIQGTEKTVLFDTGMRPEVLCDNAEQLKVDLCGIDQIVISHDHRDHTGGLKEVLARAAHATVYIPASVPENAVHKLAGLSASIVRVSKPMEICGGLWSTGELGNRIKEQSLALETEKGLVVITGCSHPGIIEILQQVRSLHPKPIFLALGGFHLLRGSDTEIKAIIQSFRDLRVEKCGPAHCSGERAIELFKSAYRKGFVRMGVGQVIEVR